MDKFLGFKTEEILTCLLLIVVGYFIAKMFSGCGCSNNGFSVGIRKKDGNTCKEGDRCYSLQDSNYAYKCPTTGICHNLVIDDGTVVPCTNPEGVVGSSNDQYCLTPGQTPAPAPTPPAPAPTPPAPAPTPPAPAPTPPAPAPTPCEYKCANHDSKNKGECNVINNDKCTNYYFTNYYKSIKQEKIKNYRCELDVINPLGEEGCRQSTSNLILNTNCPGNCHK
jgi:hypothetical protein